MAKTESEADENVILNAKDDATTILGAETDVVAMTETTEATGMIVVTEKTEDPAVVVTTDEGVADLQVPVGTVAATRLQTTQMCRQLMSILAKVSGT